MEFYKEIIEIIFLSLFVSVTSTLVAASIGIALAVPAALKNFTMKKYILRFSEILMSTPPVLMGLLIYLLLSRRGPLGSLELLFTPTAMIIAQTLLVLPIIFGLSASAISKQGKEVFKTCVALGAGRRETALYVIKECKVQLISVIAAGFGRAISEVGAVMMVGGNIKGETRVMTTYIALETGKGNFTEAITIGSVLLAVSFIVNIVLHKINGESLD